MLKSAKVNRSNSLSKNNEYCVIIEAGRVESNYWIDLWRYRELFYFLAWRDILVRYKQSVIGVAWAVIRPLLTMLVFTVVFGNLAKMPSENVPYPVLVFAAMLPWQFFSNALSECSNSLITNSNLITKIYFPRLIIPASSVIVCLVDFLVSSTILVLLMYWYQYWPTIKILFLPVFAILAFLAAVGGGLLLAALNVEYRDFRYIVPFIVQIGLYISPVGFSSSVIPQAWRLVYAINPMVGVIDGFRWAIFRESTTLYLPGLTVSATFVLFIFGLGIWYFRRSERQFADVV